ncbi:MAG: sulfite exporter TauE/SafE family protein [Balneolaceae bacterium]
MLLILGLLVVGIFTGMLAGIFGIGGGTLFTPVLFLMFTSIGVEQPVAWTIGTSLFCTFAAALSSSLQQAKHKNSFTSAGLQIGLLGAGGVYLGKMVSTSTFYTEEVFVSVFALLLVFVAYLFYRRGKSTHVIESSSEPVPLNRSAIVGLGGGFVAALAGVGGGVVIVPSLNLGFRMNIAKAVSISSLAVLIISLSGWLQFALFSGTAQGATNYVIGFVDFGTALPLIIGAFAGGFLGVSAGQKIPQNKRQVAFSVLALIVAGIMIYKII